MSDSVHKTKAASPEDVIELDQLNYSWKNSSQPTIDQIKSLKARVLLVEDEPFGQKIVTLLLRDELSCRLDIAPSGNAALQLAESSRYDLIFMDIGLPDISGFIVTKTIRQSRGLNCKAPIIALTAHTSNIIKQQCIECGMDNHITKPASINDFSIALWKYITRN